MALSRQIFQDQPGRAVQPAFVRFPAERQRLSDFVDRQLVDVTQEHELPIVSLAQDLLHRLALGQFIDQFVEISKFLHEWLLDVFDPDAADDAGNQRS